MISITDLALSLLCLETPEGSPPGQGPSTSQPTRVSSFDTLKPRPLPPPPQSPSLCFSKCGLQTTCKTINWQCLFKMQILSPALRATESEFWRDLRILQVKISSPIILNVMIKIYFNEQIKLYLSTYGHLTKCSVKGTTNKWTCISVFLISPSSFPTKMYYP